MSYETFERSCRNFEEFATARKVTIDTGLTYEEAVEACRDFNSNRTPSQIEKGTKLEFTEE